MGVLAGRYDDGDTFSTVAKGLPADSRAAQVGGIYAERVTARGIEVGRRFAGVAAEAGLSPAQLAVLWNKEQPGVTAPIVGPRTAEQLEEVLPVLEMSLAEEVREACDELVPPGTAVVDFHNTADWMKMGVPSV